jgi:hypothetical protein
MYVWSGSAWVSVAAEVESLATYATQSYADNAPGMKLIVPSSVAVGSGSGSIATQGTVTFSGASSISLNGCFSSTYDNYQIVISIDANSAISDNYLRMRASGTDNSESQYRYGGNLRNWAGTLDWTNSTGGTLFPAMSIRTTYAYFSAQFNFFNTGTCFTTARPRMI